MTRTATILGAGILGSLTAWRLARRGWRVTVLESRDPFTGTCSLAAAGMLDTIGVIEDADALVCDLGNASMEEWPAIFRELPHPPALCRNGSLAVAHPHDGYLLSQLRDRIRRVAPSAPMREIHDSELRALEPDLDHRFSRALFFPFEGHLDTRATLRALHDGIRDLGGTIHFGSRVERVSADAVRTDGATIEEPGRIVDCRGLGAKTRLGDLRGVRGELIHVETSEVRFQRPVRLLHPRQPIYVVPRPPNRLVIGATQIECEDYRPVSVRSALELLGAAYALSSAIGEAEIVELVSQCRPAFADNLPRLRAQDGILSINGMFRHGYLGAPMLTRLAVEWLETGKTDERFSRLYEGIWN